jgi:hypothetical protein
VLVDVDPHQEEEEEEERVGAGDIEQYLYSSNGLNVNMANVDDGFANST